MLSKKQMNKKGFRTPTEKLKLSEISLDDLDNIIDDFEVANGKMPYVKKYNNGLVEIFDGTHSIYTNDGGLNSFNEELKKLGDKYVPTTTK